MITAQECFNRYGDPGLEKHMTLWDVPAELEIGIIPKKIYCNQDMIEPLTNAFHNLIKTGAVNELKTWDGCFCVRKTRGYEKSAEISRLSLHSWGVAIDVNASWNKLGSVPQLTPLFVKCFTDAGFDWGGDFRRMDGMHFQLAKLP